MMGRMTDQAETPYVRYAVDGAVATLTLDSPHNRNALSRKLVTELFEGLGQAETDDTVRVILLRSADRVFCSGADLSEAATTPMEEGARAIVQLQRRIVASEKPVVVRLDGPVRAGGTGIVASADVVIASEEAHFALTEVKLGVAPAIISLTVLPRLTSRAAALTCLAGEKFGAAEAAAYGLVTVAVPADQVDARVAAVCASLATGHPQGLRETKKLLNRELLADIDARGEELAQLSARLFGTDEAREAMMAFLTRGK
jgi:enoyl-CoA hydratase/methylglutaconyl-CoA hydratase